MKNSLVALFLLVSFGSFAQDYNLRNFYTRANLMPMSLISSDTTHPYISNMECDEKDCCGEKEKMFNLFASVYGGFDEGKSSVGSIEYGVWGNTVPFMFSASLDYVYNKEFGKSYWFGLKQYVLVNEQNGNYFYAYTAPKINVQDKEQYVLEYGAAYYGKITSKWFYGGALGFQKHTPCVSFGLNFVH